MDNAKAIRTPMSPITFLDKDEEGKLVDEPKYRKIIGSLLYLTVSRPDIMFSVYRCARFQEAPKESHLTVVKRIFRYRFSDADPVGDKADWKSTSGTCQLLGKLLISWKSTSKKQGSVALSTTEAEYIAIGQCCAQLLWMIHQLTNYDLSFKPPQEILLVPLAKAHGPKKQNLSQPSEPVIIGSDHFEGFSSSQEIISENARAEKALGK
uniref:Uncharacterized mitochondrial protein AtMg00810-like n=1 Tax=Nicotiana tabacum TaxID=4097 RepID=A0A1S3X582_TOBAC|nr:PREDICTED: uncharacterized mitochondrial protein AtMg00810-like [Nicotiana tabacum]